MIPRLRRGDRVRLGARDFEVVAVFRDGALSLASADGQSGFLMPGVTAAQLVEDQCWRAPAGYNRNEDAVA